MKTLIKCNLPIGFKLGVSFSPLHADGNHSIEDKETCARHGIKSHKSTGSEGQIHFIRQGASPEVPTVTDAVLHVRLNQKNSNVRTLICDVRRSERKQRRQTILKGKRQYSSTKCARALNKLPEMRLPRCTLLPSDKLKHKPWLHVI